MTKNTYKYRPSYISRLAARAASQGDMVTATILELTAELPASPRRAIFSARKHWKMARANLASAREKLTTLRARVKKCEETVNTFSAPSTQSHSRLSLGPTIRIAKRLVAIADRDQTRMALNAAMTVYNSAIAEFLRANTCLSAAYIALTPSS
jgi:hypothetical protein